MGRNCRPPESDVSPDDEFVAFDDEDAAAETLTDDSSHTVATAVIPNNGDDGNIATDGNTATAKTATE